MIFAYKRMFVVVESVQEKSKHSLKSELTQVNTTQLQHLKSKPCDSN